MKFAKSLLLALTIAFVAMPASAESSYQQDRVNITIQVVSFDQAADDLREMADQYDAKIQNLNLSRDSTSGSVNLRVSPENLAALVKDLSVSGAVMNQSQSTNDFTSNFEQYSRRLKTYHSLQKLNLADSFNSLPPDQRDAAQVEFKNWLTNQINSAQSSLRSYEAQSQYSEIYISFVLGQGEGSANPPTEASDEPAPAESGDQKSPPPHRGPAPEFFILCLINILGLWLIYRKIDNQHQVGLND